MKTVVYTSVARRGLAALPPSMREQVRDKLARYVETSAGDVTSLRGAGGSRLRSGDSRVVFRETDAQVEVLAVGHRRDP